MLPLATNQGSFFLPTNQMKCIPTAIPEVLIIEPQVFGDERGFFFESFNRRQFTDLIGRDVDFVQDSRRNKCIDRHPGQRQRAFRQMTSAVPESTRSGQPVFHPNRAA
jgi:hypothetical protein